MHFTEMDGALLLQLTLIACGVGWAVTGSKIGKWLRIAWHLATGWIPMRPLSSLAFCPPCCTWWCGAGVALWAWLPWYNVLQVAFTSSLVMAVLNAQWKMDADDKEQIEKLLWSGGAAAVPESEERQDG